MHNDVNRESNTIPVYVQHAYDHISKWVQSNEHMKKLGPEVKVGSVSRFANNGIIMKFFVDSQKYKIEIVPRGNFFYLKRHVKGNVWESLGKNSNDYFKFRYIYDADLETNIIDALYDEDLLAIDPADTNRGRQNAKRLGIVESRFMSFDEFYLRESTDSHE